MTDIKPLNLESDSKPMVTPMVTPTKAKAKTKMVVWLGVLILLGVASGYGVFKFNQPKSPEKLGTGTEGKIEKGKTYGVKDEKAFPDSTEGKLESGGIDGEGSHHLAREGGVSQTVYLTSSVIDLDLFTGKQVKVWGQTFEAQKAGWLMDVGRLEVLE